MIFDRLSSSNGLRTIEVDADRIDERKERNRRERKAGEEAKFRRLGAKVKDCDCDGGDVD